MTIRHLYSTGLSCGARLLSGRPANLKAAVSKETASYSPSCKFCTEHTWLEVWDITIDSTLERSQLRANGASSRRSFPLAPVSSEPV